MSRKDLESYPEHDGTPFVRVLTQQGGGIMRLMLDRMKMGKYTRSWGLMFNIHSNLFLKGLPFLETPES